MRPGRAVSGPAASTAAARSRLMTKDTLTNYEIGFKTSWAGTFRLNGAIYWQEWRKFQFSFLGQNSFTEIHNGPDARIRGAELELNWRPIAGLHPVGERAPIPTPRRGGTCACSTIRPSPARRPGPDNLVSAPAGHPAAGDAALQDVGAPARYEFPLGRRHRPCPGEHDPSKLGRRGPAHRDRPAGHRRHRQSGGADRPAATAIPPPISPSASNGARFTAELFVENAFDERAQLTRFQQCGQCFQRPYIVTNTPRTIGVRDRQPVLSGGAMSRNAIVTGGGSGVGRATALALAEAGWQVLDQLGGGARSLDSVCAEGGDALSAEICDVSDEASVAALFAVGGDAVRADRPAVQQCRRRRTARAGRRCDARRLAEGDGDQRHRRVPVRARSLPADGPPGSAGRPDHQQRLAVGADAAALVDRLHGLQTCASPASPACSRSKAARTISPAARSTSAMPPPR